LLSLISVLLSLSFQQARIDGCPSVLLENRHPDEGVLLLHSAELSPDGRDIAQTALHLVNIGECDEQVFPVTSGVLTGS
jgi:hypothetical protein